MEGVSTTMKPGRVVLFLENS